MLRNFKFSRLGNHGFPMFRFSLLAISSSLRFIILNMLATGAGSTYGDNTYFFVWRSFVCHSFNSKLYIKIVGAGYYNYDK